jgi:hypothetical protein
VKPQQRLLCFQQISSTDPRRYNERKLLINIAAGITWKNTRAFYIGSDEPSRATLPIMRCDDEFDALVQPACRNVREPVATAETKK